MPWPIMNRAIYVNTNALVHNNEVDINLSSVHSDTYLDGKPFVRDVEKCEEIDVKCMLFKIIRLK